MTQPASRPAAPAEGARAAAWLREARYLSGHPSVHACPPDAGAELAFAGRSNVGKSSLLNALCARRALARTSATPGRTRLLHFFEVAPGRRLVDLPGYGFARAAKRERAAWGRMVEEYLQARASLAGLMLVMDARHPLRDSDRRMLEWCAHARLPVHALLNKADKLSKAQAARACAAVGAELACPVHAVSARRGDALGEVRCAVRDYLEAGDAER